MLIHAIVTREDLLALIDELAPLRIDIDVERGRTITLDRPELVFVSGRGVRFHGEARIVWDVAGVPIPVTIKAWQLMLVPRVVARDFAHALSFEPVIENLDLKLVPGFIDDAIAQAISEALTRSHERIAWNFTRTLARSLALPSGFSPARCFEIRAAQGAVSVTDDELRLTIRFDASFVGSELLDGRTPKPGVAPPRETRDANAEPSVATSASAVRELRSSR